MAAISGARRGRRAPVFPAVRCFAPSPLTRAPRAPISAPLALLHRECQIASGSAGYRL